MTSFYFVPDNELFLGFYSAFDFSKARFAFAKLPKTESNFIKPIVFSSP
jgi:hypothetical protein